MLLEAVDRAEEHSTRKGSRYVRLVGASPGGEDVRKARGESEWDFEWYEWHEWHEWPLLVATLGRYCKYIWMLWFYIL